MTDKTPCKQRQNSCKIGFWSVISTFGSVMTKSVLESVLNKYQMHKLVEMATKKHTVFALKLDMERVLKAC